MERAEEKKRLNSPLIQISEENVYGVNRETRDDNENGFGRKKISEEVKKQLWLAWPMISVSLLQFCLQMISVMFVGHLGELALSGASMATSFASVTGFSLLVSFLLLHTSTWYACEYLYLQFFSCCYLYMEL